MPAARAALPAVVLAGLAVAGCGAQSGSSATSAVAAPTLTGAQARPAAPAAAGTLARIADGPAARERLGYVNLARLGELDGVVPRKRLLRTVLRGGAARLERLPPRAATAAAQVGGATLVRGSRLPRGSGASAGRGGAVLGGPADLVATLRDPAPAASIGNVRGQTVVQTCLGDPVVQTTARFAGFNVDQEAVGVALRRSLDPPAGVQLIVCYAPRLVRRVDTGKASFRRAFAGVPAARVIEEEYGEDLAVSALVPATKISRAQLLGYLAGGRALSALLDRR